jgi:hypothetical protein
LLALLCFWSQIWFITDQFFAKCGLSLYVKLKLPPFYSLHYHFKVLANELMEKM